MTVNIAPEFFCFVTKFEIIAEFAYSSVWWGSLHSKERYLLSHGLLLE